MDCSVDTWSDTGHLLTITTHNTTNIFHGHTYQNCLPGSLDPVQPQEQRRGILCIRGSVTRLMGLHAAQEKRDAVLGFIVEDLGHGGVLLSCSLLPLPGSTTGRQCRGIKCLAGVEKRLLPREDRGLMV